MTRAFFCDGCREYKLGEPLGHYIKNDAHLSNNKLTSGHLDFETIREYCDECSNWIDTHQPPPKYARKEDKN